MIYLTVIAGLQLALIAFLLWDKARDRAAAAEERSDLLWRIQAPEIAVMQHEAQAATQMPLHVPFDDDDAFHESKEELAEQGWKDELSGAH